MPRSYDVIIAGLGATGSAAAYELARSGSRVLGIDRRPMPQAQSPAPGAPQLFRRASLESLFYLPFAERAAQRWADLEREARTSLLEPVGALLVAPEDSSALDRARRSGAAAGTPTVELSGAQLRSDYPGLRPTEDLVGLLEPGAALLSPERCLSVWQERARHHGAELHFGENVNWWEANERGVTVATGDEAYRAERLLLAAGARLETLAGGLALWLWSERQPFYRFETVHRLGTFDASRFPAVLWEYEPDYHLALFPSRGEGVGAMLPRHGEAVPPDEDVRDASPDEKAYITHLVRRLAPGAAGRLSALSVGRQTNTPDRQFIIDTHPQTARVVLASAGGGDGLALAPAIGELLAELILTGGTASEIGPFRLARLGRFAR